MELCSDQCLHRTFYAVLFGISPIVVCLFLIGLARLILHCLELLCTRGQTQIDRRRSSSIFYQTGRPTLSYTPVSITELQRIIQGKYDQRQASDSSSSSFIHHERESPKATHFMKSILNRHESSPPLSTDTLANLVIRRNAINSAPFTALLAPTTPQWDVINEQMRLSPNLMTIRRKSTERVTLSARNSNDNLHPTIFYNTNESWEPESTENDPLVTLPKALKTTTTTTTTVVVEEFLDFHSVHSVPYSLNRTMDSTSDEEDDQ